jgi:hypothetical protein
MGQSNSSNKGSQSSNQSDIVNNKKKVLSKTKKSNQNKESFRRHSILNLFNNNINNKNNNKTLKLNKSEINILNIIDKSNKNSISKNFINGSQNQINNNNSSQSEASSRFNSSNTLDKLSIKSDLNHIIKNRVLENLKRRESRSLSPSPKSSSRKTVTTIITPNSSASTTILNRKTLPPVTLSLTTQIYQKQKMVLKPKTNQIYDDYFISKQVLGLGISGKVLSCTCKRTQAKYALKVKFTY